MNCHVIFTTPPLTEVTGSSSSVQCSKRDVGFYKHDDSSDVRVADRSKDGQIQGSNVRDDRTFTQSEGGHQISAIRGVGMTKYGQFEGKVLDTE